MNEESNCESLPVSGNQMIIPAALAGDYEKYVNRDEICRNQIAKKRKISECNSTAESSAMPAISMDYPYDIEEERLPKPSPGTSRFYPPKNVNFPSKKEDGNYGMGRTRKFAVLYGKCSTRKHKKWENDGYLQVSGRRGVLFDQNLKVVASATGFKYKQLEELTDGSRIVVGMFEVEIENEEENFAITSDENRMDESPIAEAAEEKTVPQTAEIENAPAVKLKRPFVVPMKERNFEGATTSRVATSGGTVSFGARGPLYNPDAPDALVMPDELIRDTQIPEERIKVVMDPRLTTHLRVHQREGVKFLYSRLMHKEHSKLKCGAILADDMGLGKSLQCIALIWTLLKQTPYPRTFPVFKRVLIVVPSSLVQNWAQEFKKWLGNERLRTLVVMNKKDIDEFKTTWRRNPVMIISYDSIIRSSQEAISKIGFDLLLCDEAHRLKNAQTKVYSFLSDLDIPRRILITGTPIQNNLTEFYALMDLANPDSLGTQKDFKRSFENPINASHAPDCSEIIRTTAAEAQKDLQKITRRFLIRRTADTNAQYLPPKSNPSALSVRINILHSQADYILFCRPSSLQREIYLRIPKLKGLESPAEVGGFSAQHLSCIDCLRKLCNHPLILHKSITNGDPDSEEGSVGDEVLKAFPDEFDARETRVDHSGKLSVLYDLLESLSLLRPRQKVVVVSSFRRTLDMIEDMCFSMSYPILRLDGKTPQDHRLKIVNQFNSPQDKTFVFLLSCKAGGMGLNLIGASRLVLFDLDWNPATDLQAMGRVWRDGQINLCRIYRLVTVGTIEERILQRQVKKQGLNGACMNDASQVTGDQGKVKFSPEELKDLFRLDDDTKCQTHRIMGCNCQNSEVDTSSTNLVPNKKTSSLSQLLSWTHLSEEAWLAGDGRAEEWWRDSGALSFVFYHKTENTVQDDVNAEI